MLSKSGWFFGVKRGFAAVSFFGKMAGKPIIYWILPAVEKVVETVDNSL